MEGLEGNIGGLYTASNATRVGSVVNMMLTKALVPRVASQTPLIASYGL